MKQLLETISKPHQTSTASKMAQRYTTSQISHLHIQNLGTYFLRSCINLLNFHQELSLFRPPLPNRRLYLTPRLLPPSSVTLSYPFTPHLLSTFVTTASIANFCTVDS